MLDSLDRPPLPLFYLFNNRPYLSFTGIKGKDWSWADGSNGILGYRVAPSHPAGRVIISSRNARPTSQPFRPFDDAQPARRPR